MVTNIRKPEKDVLITQKVYSDKKDWDQATEEVERDIAFIKNFNKEVAAKKAEIKELEKKRNQVQIDFEKGFKKLKKQEEAERVPKNTNPCFASTYHLNRILRYLETVESANLTMIKADCCIYYHAAKNALDFLVKHNMIERKGDYYSKLEKKQ